jgi:feruloyl-CoA synthase
VLRLAFLTGKMSIDAGELTDKGALNQRTILRHLAAQVDALYADVPSEHVICVNEHEAHTEATRPYRGTDGHKTPID